MYIIYIYINIYLPTFGWTQSMKYKQHASKLRLQASSKRSHIVSPLMPPRVGSAPQRLIVWVLWL